MPVIQSIFATGSPALRSGTITVTASAQSAQGLPLFYFWTVSDGSWAIASGLTDKTLTLVAPDVYEASTIVTVTVTDTDGKIATASLGISTIGNGTPTISGISIFPQPVMTSAAFGLSAFDPNGDMLSYYWYLGGIAIATDPTRSIVQWKSPGIPGYAILSAKVTDAASASVFATSYVNIGSTSPWPKFRRDIQGTGQAPAFFEHENEIAWTFAANNVISSSPIVGPDNTIYFVSYDGYLYAVKNGAMKWRCFMGGGKSSPALGADGIVYVGSPNGIFYAISPPSPLATGVAAKLGVVKWAFSTGAAITSSPAIGSDGTLYFGSFDAYFYAIKPDGKLKWRFYCGSSIEGSPSIGADGTVYFGSGNGYFYAVNPDGTMKWRFFAGRAVISCPAIATDGSIYFGSTDTYVYALKTDGTLKWRFRTDGQVTSSPALGSDGTVYIGSADGYLYALNGIPIPPPGNGGRTPNGTVDITQGGILKWYYPTATVDSISTSIKGVASSPAIAGDGSIYFGANDDDFYVLRFDGALIWKTSTEGAITSSPAIATDGTVYFGSADGKLYAVK